MEYDFGFKVNLHRYVTQLLDELNTIDGPWERQQCAQRHRSCYRLVWDSPAVFDGFGRRYFRRD